jgi:hypothetical protein
MCHIADYRTIKLIPIKDGKLLIKELPDLTEVNCSRDGCDDFAEFLIFMVNDSGVNHLTSNRCNEHTNELIGYAVKGIPAHVYH